MQKYLVVVIKVYKSKRYWNLSVYKRYSMDALRLREFFSKSNNELPNGSIIYLACSVNNRSSWYHKKYKSCLNSKYLALVC